MRSRLAFSLAVLTSAALLLGSLAGIVLAEFGLHPPRLSGLPGPPPAGWETAEIRSADGVRLRAWYAGNAAAPAPPRGAVLVLHGVAAHRGLMMRLARLMRKHGYAVLVPDFRAAGDSEGDLATFGVLEAGDLRRWIDYLRSRGQAGCVYGMGESMGAAILLESLDREPRICAAAAEASFSDFREIAYDRVCQAIGISTHTPRFLLWTPVTAGFLYARLRYGIDLDQASPARAIAASRTPVLLIHSEADRNIGIGHAHRLVAASAGRAQLWELPTAHHTGAYSAEPAEFERRVITFFEQHK
jgi:uncharacterized protein